MKDNQLKSLFVLDQEDEFLYLRNDEARQYNIGAARGVIEAVRSTFGPRGIDKMLVSEAGNTTVTNDGVTVLNSMNLDHPAAKILVQAARTQEEEVGDGTTTAILFAGALLRAAEDLLEKGLHPVLIIDGYHIALEQIFEYIDNMTELVDPNDDEALKEIACTSLTGTTAEVNVKTLVPLLIEGVRRTTDDGVVDFDSMCLHSHTGQSVTQSELFTGAILEEDACHKAMPCRIDDAQVLLLDASVELEATEHEVRVEFDNADSRAAFLADEESRLRAMVQGILETDANMVLATGNIDDRAATLFASHDVLAVDHLDWSDAKLEFLRDALDVAVITDPEAATKDVLGHVSVHRNDENDCFYVECEDGHGVSLVLKGSTQSVVNEVERSARNALDVLACVISDSRTLPGAGATEIELATRLRSHANGVHGPQQLAVRAFADALESIPRILVENAGLEVVNIMTKLRTAHATGDENATVDIFDGEVIDALNTGIIEPALVKEQALLGATQTVAQILKIDLVVSAKNLSMVAAGDDESN